MRLYQLVFKTNVTFVDVTLVVQSI